MSLTTTLEGRNETRSFILPAEGPGSSARTVPELAELWKWTFDRKAIASCFVKDVFSMKDNLDQAASFFWLGRVPCRSVQIVGLIVGVQIYERYTRYTVDDGTAVVDCRHHTHVPRTPIKKKIGKETGTMPHFAPQPVATVGMTVRVVGRVVRRFETREITVDTIEPCTSPNDEPLHWLEVHRLHKEYYSLTAPFQIPRAVAPSNTASNLSLPIKSLAMDETSGHIASHTLLTTPSTTYSTSPGSNLPSPSKSTAEKSPIKLRHPTRLRSRDLNGDTFRVYVKHYMDRMIQMKLTTNTSPDSDGEVDPQTPTKHPRQTASHKTPRANASIPSSASLHTPRPRITPLSIKGPELSTKPDSPRLAGFTVSYLRRVPELAEMAKGVVNTVTKRRVREERKKIKEAAAPSGPTRPPKQSTSTSLKEEANKLAPRIKRLFQSTMIQLLREGSIILWDGPVLPISWLSTGPQSGVWKSSMASMSLDNSVFSAPSTSRQLEDLEDWELSEPDSNEEAFMPLTPQFLAEVLESVIGKLANLPKQRGKGRTGYLPMTKERILAHMKRDDRWRYLSEWSVDEALNILKTEGRAWCVGKENWELSI